jgi:hypothetical protein
MVSVEDLDPGTYKLKVRVRDECQNESYCDYTFTMEANKRPTPICITSLTAELTPMDMDQNGEPDTAMAVVWAYEFDQSSYAPCGETGQLDFYIEIKDDGFGDDSTLDSLDADSLVLGCSHMGTQFVRLWVKGESGSYDFCDVILIVQNNMGGCTEQVATGSLVGNFVTELGSTVQHVEVVAESNLALQSIATGEAGSYNFVAPMGSVVTLTPTKNSDPTNGVTTMDLFRLLTHINNTDPLTSPYRHIAADVSRDGFINSLDLLEMRELILGEIDFFKNNNSWRFVLDSYTFTTSTPEQESIPERSVISVDNEEITQDFIGIKIGDLDVDNDPSLKGPRSANPFVLVTNDMVLEAGKTYEVSFRSENFDQLLGYQYSLKFDPDALAFQQVIPGKNETLQPEMFGFRNVEKGIITTSWISKHASDVTLEDDTELYAFAFTALKTTKLSNVITVNSQITSAEAYKVGTRSEVSLRFTGNENTFKFNLLQNRPNPFADKTIVEFFVSGDQNVILTVTDVNGQVFQIFEDFYQRGIHQKALDRDVLGASGIYYVTLTDGKESMTKKMVLID